MFDLKAAVDCGLVICMGAPKTACPTERIIGPMPETLPLVIVEECNRETVPFPQFFRSDPLGTK